MNWNRDNNKTPKCPFPLDTEEAAEWFIKQVTGRRIRWTGWSHDRGVIIGCGFKHSGIMLDILNNVWHIYGGFSPTQGILNYWEFADELE